ncbi:hypothetical protein M5K25_007181 [Dendrobium thyrsiflorum]|uniref:WRKY domain-containing protein n=1 Tax=Dendrobium thyrsiflorum TaxID=117978 RepID=A0ABD0VEL0_DENTH
MAIIHRFIRRSYFRCTHKNFYGCKAKRKVQRLDADPNTYEITYCGNHTCQTSPTPLILPSMTPSTNENVAIITGASPPSAFPLSTSIELSTWFLKEHESEGTRPFLSSLTEVGESSRAHAGPSEQPPPVRTGREGEGSVADFADVMLDSDMIQGLRCEQAACVRFMQVLQTGRRRGLVRVRKWCGLAWVT